MELKLLRIIKWGWNELTDRKNIIIGEWEGEIGGIIKKGRVDDHKWQRVKYTVITNAPGQLRCMGESLQKNRRRHQKWPDKKNVIELLATKRTSVWNGWLVEKQ